MVIFFDECYKIPGHSFLSRKGSFVRICCSRMLQPKIVTHMHVYAYESVLFSQIFQNQKWICFAGMLVDVGPYLTLSNNEDLLLLSNFLKQALRYMYVINNLEVALKFSFLSSATADSYSFLKYLASVALKRGKWEATLTSSLFCLFLCLFFLWSFTMCLFFSPAVLFTFIWGLTLLAHSWDIPSEI